MPSLKKLVPGMGPLAYFGNELRKHREATGQTQAQVGDVVGYTDSYIGMFERGERPPGPALLKALDKHFSTIGIFERMTEILAWEIIPGWFHAWLDIERRARILRSYEPMLIPGLLQTANYARSLIRAYRPGETDETI